MKKTILLSLLITLLAIITKAQSNGWTKSDNENLFSDCKSYITKFESLTDEQRESVCMCYYEAIDKEYNKSEYQAMLDIKTKRIKETTIAQCAKNSSIELTEQKKEVTKVEPKKADSIVSKPTKENLVGHWKTDEDDEFWLSEPDMYKMNYSNGKTAKGTWSIDGDELTLNKENFLGGKSEKVYKILFFSKDTFAYKSLQNKSKLIATRVKQ